MPTLIYPLAQLVVGLEVGAVVVLVGAPILFEHVHSIIGILGLKTRSNTIVRTIRCALTYTHAHRFHTPIQAHIKSTGRCLRRHRRTAGRGLWRCNGRGSPESALCIDPRPADLAGRTAAHSWATT
jgi:hypothetical protein